MRVRKVEKRELTMWLDAGWFQGSGKARNLLSIEWRGKILNGMIDGKSFAMDGWLCEWAIVLDP